jgi:hypothetical protein
MPLLLPTPNIKGGRSTFSTDILNSPKLISFISNKYTHQLFVMRLAIIASLLAAVVAVSAAPTPFDDFDDSAFKCVVGHQRCLGKTHFLTCVPPGNKVVKQQCAHGTVCYQGWGAAKYKIWCGWPAEEVDFSEYE